MVNKDTAGVANDTDIGSSDPTNVGYQTNGWYKLSTHPLYFTRAGGLGTADYYNTTTHLYYWSATSYDGAGAYYLSANSGGLYPADRSNRAYGFSVRCVVGCVPIYHLQTLWLAGDFFILTTGTDTSGSTDTTYTLNGYTLINTNPYYFVLSGDVGGSTFYYFTGVALYWSSTAVDSMQTYSLYFGSGDVWPAGRSYRYAGRSLRCVVICAQIKY
ncbi:hypothetical protein IKF86_02455 [Candidatus Saccharibacteria bacterium]|nr:hypothetical protein [Candidatus Saccharibacteria bacterium]